MFGDDAQSFHFEICGSDSLDCHVYHSPVFRDGYELGALLLGQEEIRSKFMAHTAVAYIEASPVPDVLPAARQRVAMAVAGLLDDETLLLWDFIDDLLAPCTPETAALLKSGQPQRAFEGGVELLADAVAHDDAAKRAAAAAAQAGWGEFVSAWRRASAPPRAVVRAADLRWIDVQDVADGAVRGEVVAGLGGSGPSAEPIVLTAAEIVDWGIHGPDGERLGLFGLGEAKGRRRTWRM